MLRWRVWLILGYFANSTRTNRQKRESGDVACACAEIVKLVMLKTDVFVECPVSVAFVSVSSLGILRQSWFNGDDLVSVCIGFPRYLVCSMVMLAVICVAWILIYPVPVLFATFWENARETKHMLWDCAFRCAHHMPLLTVRGDEMTPPATER